ncbi:putative inorganic phosphate cotransporter [Agrilus planipennis]|uniref:Putative inorganic phosphate cotransporter n=1 Tax=Agrilus planipennis TaxID=224129 RepID=A0A7F5RLF6_AGRPL|nr:putative inorganic phosphate cotransporter [Agrilus planipennis]
MAIATKNEPVNENGINQETCTSRCFGWVGARHFTVFMLFLGMANAYIMRTNMSVAIVAMVNTSSSSTEYSNECPSLANSTDEPSSSSTGEYEWETDVQGYILSSFFYGYVITQIPFGILGRKYGSLYFLGFGMLVNSVFALFVPLAAKSGAAWLMAVRLIQGLGEGPIVPCTHALLAKWVPPNERSRFGSFVYAGAQFGTVISMPISGWLAASSWKWQSIFYVFGIIGTAWAIAFIIFCYEDPEKHPKIKEKEKHLILESIWGNETKEPASTPWLSILTSLPFWAIMATHMAQNYGYETLMTELPTYMNQILRFDIDQNGVLSALPYLAMWLFSMLAGQIADYLVTRKQFRIVIVRKIMNGIGQYSPAICLVAASYTGCNRALTVALLTIGVGFNGGIYSGFKVNHLDISPRFAGILMSFTNCAANLVGLLAPIYAGIIVKGEITHAKWRTVFVTAAIVYVVCNTFYLIFGAGTRQKWDAIVERDDLDTVESKVEKEEKNKQHG